LDNTSKVFEMNARKLQIEADDIDVQIGAATKKREMVIEAIQSQGVPKSITEAIRDLSDENKFKATFEKINERKSD